MTTIERVMDGCRKEGVAFRMDGTRLVASGNQPSAELAQVIELNRREIGHAVTLQTRLEAGEMKIRRLQRAGEDTTALEDFWIALLAEYVQASDMEIRYLR